MGAGLAVRSVVTVPGGRPAEDVTVPPGGVLGIVGPAGSGKTTLLEAIAGARPTAAGSVLLDDEPVRPIRVGVATQQHELLGGLTAAENVATRVLARRPLRSGDWAAITALLAALGLPESSWHNLLEQLSGGQQQRVAVARALVDDPPLVCLDDPVSELDESSARLVWEQVAAVAARGSVVVLALPDEAGGPPLSAVVRTG